MELSLKNRMTVIRPPLAASLGTMPDTTTNTPNIPSGVGHQYLGTVIEMELFDQLPRWARDMLNEAPLQFSAGSVGDAIEAGWSRQQIEDGMNRVAEFVRASDAELVAASSPRDTA